MDHTKLKNEITRRWDYSSKRYDNYHGHGVKSNEESAAWQSLFRELIPEKRMRVLDVGCGTGEMSLLLAGLGHEVHGIDLSPKMLAKAKEKAELRLTSGEQENLRFKLGDGEKPPYENGSFDVVVSRHVLWTLPSPETAIANWVAQIKENGKVVVIDALWDDGRLATQLRRKISTLLIRIIENDDLSKDSYSAVLRSCLPHSKGVCAAQVQSYFKRADLEDIRIIGLGDLMAVQKRSMPFRYSIGYTFDYYAACGRKPVRG